MSPEEYFKELINESGPSIPSIVEVLPFLEIEKSAAVDNVLKDQYSNVSRTAKELGVKKTGVERGLTFLIPLTAFMPLPSPYSASIITKTAGDELEELLGFSCVTIDHYSPKLAFGDNEYELKLSYALVTIADVDLNRIDEKLEEFPKLHDWYHVALDALNSVIHSYKSTPWRHSHVLQPVSALSQSGAVYVAFSEFPNAKIIEQNTIGLHDHLMGELFQARSMSPEELENFQKIHVSSRNWTSMPHWLISKLNQAVDARCNGDDAAAVVFADLYTELSMRFLLYGICEAKGDEPKVAKRKAQKEHKVDLLISAIAKELGEQPSKFKKDVKYSVWNQSCRKKRNILNHEVERPQISPQQSFKAVDSSALLIKNISEKVNEKYPGAQNDTQWLIMATWMTESIKGAEKL